MQETGDTVSIRKSGRAPGEGNGNPLHYSCLENPHGQRSLAGYSPWGHKESGTTEHLSTHTLVHEERKCFWKKKAVERPFNFSKKKCKHRLKKKALSDK